MKRRDFLKSVTGVAAGAMVPAPAIWSAAKADARSETLLIVSEGGPNNLDIHGVGTNVPGYEVSWNCYDRLITHEMKSGPGGVPYYDRDKFKGELADDMKIDDMSVTFKLKKKAKFHDGAPVTAKDVKWSLDRAVSVGGFPTFQMSAGSLTKPEQFVDRRRQHGARRFCQERPPDDPRSRRHRALHRQLGAGEEERQREGSLGSRIHQAADRGLRRLQADEMDRRHRSDHGAQRRLGRWSLAEDQARDLAHGAAGRQPPRAARARRRRHLL